MFHDMEVFGSSDKSSKVAHAALVLVAYVDSEWYVTVDFWYAAVVLQTNGTYK